MMTKLGFQLVDMLLFLFSFLCGTGFRVEQNCSVFWEVGYYYRNILFLFTTTITLPSYLHHSFPHGMGNNVRVVDTQRQGKFFLRFYGFMFYFFILQ